MSLEKRYTPFVQQEVIQGRRMVTRVPAGAVNVSIQYASQNCADEAVRISDM